MFTILPTNLANFDFLSNLLIRWRFVDRIALHLLGAHQQDTICESRPNFQSDLVSTYTSLARVLLIWGELDLVHVVRHGGSSCLVGDLR